jgi:hypothetical protein
MQNDVGFAIGNGLSREFFDLDRLRGKGITVGCNYLYKHWAPDYLVTLDHGISETIGKMIADKPQPWKHLTRYYPDHDNKRTWLCCNGEPVKPLIEINQGFNNNSGVMAAAYLAEIKRVHTLYLLGIDFFLDVPGRANDLYSRNTRQSAGLSRVWNLLVERNPQTTFIRVGTIHDRDAMFYDTKLIGFDFIDYKDFPY